MPHGLYCIAKEKGVSGLTNGFAVTLMKEGINCSLRFPIFEALSTFLNSLFPSISTLNNFIAGSVGGFISVAITQPFDSVKTNLQGLEADMYEGAIDCARKLKQ